MHIWEEYHQAKIVLGVKDEKDMLALKDKAQDKGLITWIIRDAGRTQVESGTQTCCAIGPGKISEIDSVTKHLELL